MQAPRKNFNIQPTPNIVARSMEANQLSAPAVYLTASSRPAASSTGTGRMWMDSGSGRVMFTDDSDNHVDLVDASTGDGQHLGSGAYSVAIGGEAKGAYSVALGHGSYVGYGAYYYYTEYDYNRQGANSVAIGKQATVYCNYGGVAIGAYAEVHYDCGVTLGYAAYAIDESTAVGGYARAGHKEEGDAPYAEECTAVGYMAEAVRDGSVAVGAFASAASAYSLAVGYAAATRENALASAASGYNTAVGAYAVAEGYGATAIGGYAHANGDYSTAIGYMAYAAESSTAFGAYSHAANGCTVLGYGQSSGTVEGGFFVSPVRAMGGGSAVTLLASGELVMDTSSARFKSHIRDAEEHRTKDMSRVKPRRFELAEKHGGHAQVGFVAEEMESVFPEMVTRDAKGHLQGVRYDRLTTLLWQEAQRMRRDQAKIEGHLAVLAQ